MESQVENRTRDLRTVVEVSNRISTILNVERLLQDVVDLVKERFRLYHAHIYLLDDVSETLLLTTGAGHVGRKMVAEERKIPLGNRDSIVATAARTRQAVPINDVGASDTFLPHPLLPNTKSELAVPLISRGRVLGTLDVQSNEVDHFTADVQFIIETLANQIAPAIDNARLFETTSQSSRHEQALSHITQSIQNANSVDEILQTAVKELGKALRVPQTAIELQLSDVYGSDESD